MRKLEILKESARYECYAVCSCQEEAQEALEKN